MKPLLYVSAALIPAGVLLDWYAFAAARENVAVVPLELCLVLLAPLYLARHLGARGAPLFAAPEWRPILFFALWAGYSLLLAAQHFRLMPHQVIVSGLFLGRWCAYAVLYFVMCDMALAEQRTVLRILFVGMACFAVFGIFQAIFLPNFAFDLIPARLGYFVPDIQGHRLVSTLMDPNIAGGFIDLFALLALSLYAHGDRKSLWAFLLFATALAMTLSRGSFAGFAAGSLVLVSSRGFRRDRLVWIALFCCVVLAVAWPLLYRELVHFHKLGLSDYSARTRFQDWRYAGLMFRRNWLYGIGFNTFAYVSPLYGIARRGGSAFGFAGDLLLIPVTTGVVGTVVYGWLLAKVWVSSARVLRGGYSEWEKGFASGVRAGLASSIVCSLFTSVLLYSSVMAALWLLWAHLHTLARSRGAERGGALLPPRRGSVAA